MTYFKCINVRLYNLFVYLKGGSDFSVPLSILSIVPNSVADRCGLRPGDAILKINDAEVSWMDHGRAKTEIIRAGNEFYLTVERFEYNFRFVISTIWIV